MGEPTYEILKERRSIIDYGLTNAKSIVKNFEVLPIHLGASPQTCHKIIRLTIKVGINKEIISRSISERQIFRSLTEQNVNKYVSLLVKQFQILDLNLNTDVSYDQISQLFYYCKSKILRFKSGKKIRFNKTSTEIKNIQAKLN